jgi:cell division protease FtsH
VGVGASRVRDLFKKAKQNAPCIIFIDEIDAVGRQRGAGLGGGHDEREQTLNQILTEMDGFETNSNVIVMAATNRPDVLDPALLRPGRFDRRVVVDSPSINDREEILTVHARNKPLAKSVNLRGIAKQTPGFSGADLENLMNEAAILAARNDKTEISMKDVELSIEKVQLGPERKSHVLSKLEKEVTAYHETGHAIVGHVLADCDPVKKITIVSRGMSLGATWFVPEEDTHLYTKQKFEHEMASLLGGYVAEEMIYGQVSTGPSNDLERASAMARRMVTEFGMSPLGPTVYGEKNHEIFLGRDYGHAKNYSEERAAEIDSEVNDFVQRAYKQAKELLSKHKDRLEAIAKKLIEVETLDREEFVNLFENKKLKTKSA